MTQTYSHSPSKAKAARLHHHHHHSKWGCYEKRQKEAPPQAKLEEEFREYYWMEGRKILEEESPTIEYWKQMDG